MAKSKKHKPGPDPVPLADAALVAFGQGTGRIGIDEEALAFLRDHYESPITQNEDSVRRRYRVHLAAARDLGLLTRQLADREGSVSISRHHVEHAAQQFIHINVPCPACSLKG